MTVCGQSNVHLFRRRVDLSQTIIFITANLGAVQIKELITGGIGLFLERTAIDAARRKFSPEFVNRLDKLVVFHPLRREQLQESNGGGSPAVSLRRRHGPTLWGKAPKARY
jgi:hypothetical protein